MRISRSERSMQRRETAARKWQYRQRFENSHNHRARPMQKSISPIALMSALFAGHAFAQAPKMQTCESAPPPAFCSAVRGVRTEGWPVQSRSEVMAQHGMVVTSQPLAAQAGLQILRHGGNAIHAAGAAGRKRTETQLMSVGLGA